MRIWLSYAFVRAVEVAKWCARVAWGEAQPLLPGGTAPESTCPLAILRRSPPSS